MTLQNKIVITGFFSVGLDIPKIQINIKQIIQSRKVCKTDDQMTVADLISKTNGVIQEVID